MKIISILLSFIFLISCQSTSTSKKVTVKPLPQIEKSKYQPIVRIDPKYPRKAAENKQTGWVHVKFDINKLGEVQNIRFIDVSPKEFHFEHASYRAISKWKYKPIIIGGSKRVILDQEMTLMFSIR